METALRIAVAIFLALHGLVHLWYVVLSQGWVDVQDQMGWSGHSWLFSPVLSRETILRLASVGYVLVAVGFSVGTVAFALRLDWWVPVVVGAAGLSTSLIVALWDGRVELLVEKEVVGVLINISVLGWLLWPV